MYGQPSICTDDRPYILTSVHIYGPPSVYTDGHPYIRTAVRIYRQPAGRERFGGPGAAPRPRSEELLSQERLRSEGAAARLERRLRECEAQVVEEPRAALAPGDSPSPGDSWPG